MTKTKNRIAVIPEKTIELEPHHFQCQKCKTIHKMSFYAIAQTGMGVPIVFTCECGHKTNL